MSGKLNRIIFLFHHEYDGIGIESKIKCDFVLLITLLSVGRETKRLDFDQKE